MMKSSLLYAVPFFFGIASAISATTPNSPVIDGVLEVSDDDWQKDERIVAESMFDSAWGQHNETGDLYMTWDEKNLYLGCAYIVDSNALLICLDAGTSSTEDGTSSLGELDWYPRNIQFLTMYPEFIIALWNADLSTGGIRRIVFDADEGRVKTEPVSHRWATSALSGKAGDLEVAIPWTSIYSTEGGVIPEDAVLKVVSVIAGSDYSAGGDSAPDNGEITSGKVVSFYRIDPDRHLYGEDGYGKPDSGVSTGDEGSIESLANTELDIHSMKLSPRCIGPSEDHVTLSLDISSTVLFILVVQIVNDKGREIFARQFVIPPRQGSARFSKEFRIPLDVASLRPGIHFCRISAGTFATETASFLVVR
jgi:hypothetical protein